MKCPYCGEPMEVGFIQSARAFFWSRSKKSIFFIPSKNDIVIAKGMNGCYKEAYFCKNCNKMIFDVLG